jgi:transcription antitermination factor NusG
MTDILARWYVYQNPPQREQEAAFELAKQGFEILAPQLLKRTDNVASLTAWQRHRQKKKPLEPRPLFPGYGFVRFGRHEVQWRRINGTRNVTRLLMADEDTPLPVPGNQMDRIIKMIGPDGLIHEIDQEEPWRKVDGKMVRILEGPFADHVGLCRKSDEGRVIVLLHIMGRRWEKTLTCSEVEIA